MQASKLQQRVVADGKCLIFEKKRLRYLRKELRSLEPLATKAEESRISSETRYLLRQDLATHHWQITSLL